MPSANITAFRSNIIAVRLLTQLQRINMKYCAVLLLFVLYSCNKEGNHTQQNRVDSLTILPLHNGDISYLEPLGNLNPPGHVFPTNHCYLYLKNPAVKVPVLAPGNLRLIRIRQSLRSSGGVVTGQDYSLTFSMGGGYVLELGHISTLQPDILALFSTATQRGCSTPYQIDGVQYRHCMATVNHFVTAGEEVGKAGGQADQYALDMGTYIANKNPPHNAVCPFTFYKHDRYSNIQRRLTDADPATTAPSSLCRSYIFEAPGSAKGLWQKTGEPLYPEEKHIALVEYNRQPAFSIGIAQTRLAGGVYEYSIQNSGVINRAFEDISADGHTYCFNIYHRGAAAVIGSILLKMTNDENLLLEYRPGCECSCNTDYVFSNNKVAYTKPDM